MLISEVTFPHLQAEREARLADELERRRVIVERMTEEAETVPPVRAARRWHRRAVVGTRACAC